MSSQASSAGRDEAKVRQKLVENGAVDVMIDIRRQILLHANLSPASSGSSIARRRGTKSPRDHVLMLDARNISRKVTRAIFDFSPEQQKNIAAIVWLYRGQSERFLSLVDGYLAQADRRRASEPLGRSSAFKEALGKQIDLSYDPSPPWRVIRIRWPRLGRNSLRCAGYSVERHVKAFAAEVAARAAELGAGVENGATRDNATLQAAARRPPRHCRTLPESDQTNRPGCEVGWQSRRHCGEGTRRTGIGTLG